jgi:hypothetical protein
MQPSSRASFWRRSVWRYEMIEQTFPVPNLPHVFAREAKRRSNPRQAERTCRAALLAEGCHAIARNDEVGKYGNHILNHRQRFYKKPFLFMQFQNPYRITHI